MPISTPSSAAKIAATRITSHGLRWTPDAPLNDVPPTLDRHLRELLRAEPARDVGAGGEERDVAEVEQARVADDEVEAEAHHRERGDHEGRRGVRQPVASRCSRGSGGRRPGRGTSSAATSEAISHCLWCRGHDRVESDSPSRPLGRKTRIRISRMKTSDSVQFGPGACQVRPLLKFSMKPIT